MQVAVGDRVQYVYDPEYPYGWPHLNGIRGTVMEVDDETFAFVQFDFKPQYGALPCEPGEIVKLKEEVNAAL